MRRGGDGCRYVDQYHSPQMAIHAQNGLTQHQLASRGARGSDRRPESLLVVQGSLALKRIDWIERFKSGMRSTVARPNDRVSCITSSRIIAWEPRPLPPPPKQAVTGPRLSMENVVRLFMIQALEAKLASCEREREILAREVLCSSTSPGRKTEALIRRAEVQTTSLDLLRELQALELNRSSGWIVSRSEKSGLRPQS